MHGVMTKSVWLYIVFAFCVILVVFASSWGVYRCGEEIRHDMEKEVQGEVWEAIGLLSEFCRDKDKNAIFEEENGMLEYTIHGKKVTRILKDSSLFMTLNVHVAYDTRDERKWTLRHLWKLVLIGSWNEKTPVLPMMSVMKDSVGRIKDMISRDWNADAQFFYMKFPLGVLTKDVLYVFCESPRGEIWRRARVKVLAILGVSCFLLGGLGVLFGRFRRERRNALFRKGVTRLYRHDLRLPITVLLNRAYMLEQKAGERLTGEEQVWVREITLETRRIREAIEKLALLQACEYDLHPKREIVDVNMLVKQVVERSAWDSMASYPYTIIMDIRALRATVLGDYDLLESVVLNLVANALKYARGIVQVCVGTRAGKKGRVILWVEDNGKGIEPSDIERLFDYRFRSDGDGAIAGTGVGLCLVRSIVRLHGGRICVKSRKGKGTLFLISLPYKREWLWKKKD